MNQQPDLPLGIALKEEGQDRVSLNAALWMSLARVKARKIAAAKGSVSTDDLRPLLPSPHHPNAWGAVFRVGDGWEIAFRARSTIPSNHAREIKHWKLTTTT